MTGAAGRAGVAGLAVIAVVAIALVLFAMRFVGGQGDGSDPASKPSGRTARGAAPVVVAPVRMSGGAASLEAVGTGKALRAVVLYPRATGRVSEILFRSEQRVRRGDPLLRLDDADERLGVELARVREQDAKQLLERNEKAAPAGGVSASEVERARTAVAAARIALEQAVLALERRTLFAPFDGVTGIAEVGMGERVTEDTRISTLDDRSALLIDFDVPEAFGGGVRRGSAVSASTWALPGEQFSGKVSAVGSRIDAATRTLRVQAQVADGADRLRTGMSFVVRVPLAGNRFPSVPSVAVQWDRGGAYVWRIDSGKAGRVPVKVLKREAEWVLVDAALTHDDRVVVEGVQRLREGGAVKVQAAEVGEAGGDA